MASNQGAGASGLATAVTTVDKPRAKGLHTLSDDAFGGAPRMPMMPGNWPPASG
ncbi:hypothetical protein OQ789_24755 [Mycobacterium sp. 94-17]|nr:hypothetical protein [Mycobacterium sp. 94-17]